MLDVLLGVHEVHCGSDLKGRYHGKAGVDLGVQPCEMCCMRDVLLGVHEVHCGSALKG